MAHTIAADKCVACGCCKDACPAEAISEGTPYTIDPAKCVDCGACAAQCPNEAISPALSTSRRTRCFSFRSFLRHISY